MRKLLLWVLFFLVPFLYSIYVCAQPKQEKDCSTTCFSSEVVAVERISETCTSYLLKVSYSGDCAHALSHYSVAVPCGKIENIWNSQNWALSVGTDPTTGLSGFKIDNIANFGESSLPDFTVGFTVCSTSESCATQLSCWQPVVAYKASTCVNFETLAVSCRSLKASLEKTDASCAPAADGSLAVVIEDGQEPYTFRWSNNATAQVLTGLPAGAYSVLVSDASGAELTLEETITQPEAITVSGSTTPASCNGVANGAIDLTISGGTGAYSVIWNNGQTTEDIQSLAAGQYTVTVQDEKSCSVTKSFTIGNTSKVNISGTHVKPDCNASNGSINITLSGGTEPYTFSWSNGATTEDLQDIPSGLYTVTVNDNAGCSEKASYFIRDNNTLSLTGIVTPTSCTGDAIGAIDVTVSGGTEPYTYSWSGGQTSEDLSNLTTGYYTVTVTDGKGCTATAGFVISKTTFQVPSTVVKPVCHGDTNGSVSLGEPVGGTAPYTYAWSNGETGSSISGLDAGTYSVTVTDATGCSRTLTFIVNDPAALLATATVSNTQCNADGYFSIDLTVSGGTSPYTFEWSNGSTSEDLSGLQSGTYTVVAKDNNGCTVTKEIIVEGQPPSWSCLIDEVTTTPLCSSVGNTLSTSVLDADSYSWTIQSTDGSWSLSSSDSPSILYIAGLANTSATFTLTIVKDGCTKTCSYTISTCTSEDGEGEVPGGEDPGGEEPGSGDGGSQTCEECFNTIATLLQSSGSCRTYEMEVSTTGLCRHELSHWTLAIPCGTVSNYSNSEGWKMEYGEDPTTGLFGLKVDGINDFGNEVESFTIRFTICEGNGCDLSAWEPRVAYKAGLCVGIKTIGIEAASSLSGRVSVYPNPFNETIHFEWTAIDENANLQIIDQYGNTISTSTEPSVKSDGYYITLESSGLPRGMYYYRLTVDGQTFSGKISKL